jgi:glycerol-3-phosphate acyltransferase PlsY
METDFIYSAISGYMIGSIPTAYIFLKKAKSLDIRKNGSGNVGALNAYEVSNSKLIGVLVLIIDLLK